MRSRFDDPSETASNPVGDARAAARARFAHLADEHVEQGRTATAPPMDPDNPPLTDADLARLRPAAEVHPEFLAAKRRAGRPRVEAPKVAVSLRLDPEVVEALRATGAGWQPRTNEILRRSLGLVVAAETVPAEANDMAWLNAMSPDFVRCAFAGMAVATGDIEKLARAIRRDVEDARSAARRI